MKNERKLTIISIALIYMDIFDCLSLKRYSTFKSDLHKQNQMNEFEFFHIIRKDLVSLENKNPLAESLQKISRIIIDFLQIH